MEKRILGVDLSVSAIGFGCMGLSHAYGVALEKPVAIRLIHEAVEMGYNFFDTAEVYVGKYADGSDAVNEEIVGEALRPIRDQVVIATKGGNYWGENHQILPDGRPESIRRSIENSLKRMGLDVIDLYYQHRQDPNVEPEVVADTMKTLMQEGKIRYWGISNASMDYIRRADAVCKVAAVQERYSMMAHWNEEKFPTLEELNIGLVAYSPLANGFLTGGFTGTEQYDKNLDFRSRMPQYTESGVEKARVLMELVETLAAEKGCTLAQLSLAWMLCKKPWIVPIPGTSKSERIVENAGAANVLLTVEEIQRIDNALAGMELEVFGK